MNTTADAVIAANRFGLGARPGDLAALGADARNALREQLQGVVAQPAGPLKPSWQVVTEMAEAQRRQREARRQASAEPAAADAVAAAANIGQLLRPIYVDECVARLRLAVDSQASFIERLVHFWSNHFAVSVDKVQVLGLAGAMEREAIRPHVLGNFAAMLRAVEQHPAMLLYLDNAQSTGPQSLAVQVQRRRKATRLLGLNENLGREILELHTLGVDGGYHQQDVTTLAAMITGWSVGGGEGALQAGEPGRFTFRQALHEPGPKTLLGRTYAQDGLQQGEQALRDLALHPRTAHHLATKLVRHFVADEPPAAAVEAVARAYLQADGDLPATYTALLAHRASWDPALRKFKSPADYLHSMWRALALPVPEGARALAPYEQLGQRSFQPGSPAGWPDGSADWDGPAAVLRRIEFAHTVAQRMAGQRPVLALAQDSLGTSLSAATQTAIARALDARQGMTLWLTSPEFMRR